MLVGLDEAQLQSAEAQIGSTGASHQVADLCDDAQLCGAPQATLGRPSGGRADDQQPHPGGALRHGRCGVSRVV